MTSPTDLERETAADLAAARRSLDEIRAELRARGEFQLASRLFDEVSMPLASATGILRSVNGFAPVIDLGPGRIAA